MFGKTGDIFVENGNASVFVREEIADFIIMNLTGAGKAKVKTTERIGEFCPLEKEGKIIKVAVASMRADAVLGEAFNLSRKNSAELIKAEKVFINWELTNSVSGEIREGDVISARGFGRVHVRAVLGRSKKDRIMLKMERFF